MASAKAKAEKVAWSGRLVGVQPPLALFVQHARHLGSALDLLDGPEQRRPTRPSLLLPRIGARP